MTRVDELEKKYPDIPRDIIVKWEVVVRGIGDTEDLDKVSNWGRPVGAYQRHGTMSTMSLKEMAEKRPEGVKDGLLLLPANFMMARGLGAPIKLNDRSPYTIREVSEGNFALFEGEEKVDQNIYFPRPKTRTGEEPLTSKGTPVSNLVTLNRRCFTINPVRYCQYFSSGEECKFCNWNAAQDDARSIGYGRDVTVNLEEALEAYRIVSSEARLIEGWLMSGHFDQENKVYTKFVEKMASATSNYKPNLNVRTQALERRDYERLKDGGLDCIGLHMEVWNERLFPEIVPGKARYMSRERWLESIQDAVDVFGTGQVTVKFVVGSTWIAENGFKSLQDALDSDIEGNTWVIKHGALPAFTPYWLAPGSAWSGDPASREKILPTEYPLDLAVAHHKAMKEYGLYDKINKFMWCGLDFIVAYNGELGMFELAGDVGKWMADVVPYEANWKAQFIESLKTPARTQG